jgi:hypothetical protein
MTGDETLDEVGAPQVQDEQEVQDEESEEAQEDILPTYTIVSFGADFDVETLVNRLRKGDITFPPFQREFIWNYRQCSRFIESLLMGLPVPGIFLWRDPKTARVSVIDGKQRLLTLQAFYRGVLRRNEFSIPERTSPYQKVAPRFEGRTYATLDDEDRRRLDTSIIHATIVNQEQPPDDSSLFYIFERLNAEGTPLSAQEIRVAVYQGPLIDLLVELNKLPPWRALYGPPSPRLKDTELIARFFALFYGLSGYARPMKEFLNRYVAANRNLTVQSATVLTDLFSSTISSVSEIGPQAFRPVNALNAAVFDAVTVGIAKRIQQRPIAEPHRLTDAYLALLADQKFQESYSKATSDAESVKTRIGLAEKAFASVP